MLLKSHVLFAWPSGCGLNIPLLPVIWAHNVVKADYLFYYL